MSRHALTGADARAHMMTDAAKTSLTGDRGRSGAPRSAKSANAISTSVLLGPALLLCGVFIVVPAILAIFGSFFDFGITSQNWEFVGLGNYGRAASDPVFWIALRNNLIIVVGSIILQVGVGTILAAILDRGLPSGSTIFRTIIFAPMVVSSVAIAIIWLVILDPNVGALNAVIKQIGLTPPALGWLGDPNIAIWMILIIAMWQFTGFMMVLILAGLQGIPKELYEAASLDGARGLKAFWYITLPSIRNILIVAVLITTIGGFKVFDLIYATTQGGPANATQVLGTYIYQQAFNLGNMGYADAISVVLLLIAVALGWLQLQISRRA
ncbi:sugar ABC transporter permease [Devosia algicola]|uniref:Sugar ABC transporter permease n=1 Tax=Devosia algicola TaxID=3026418 RepID=A0ABY7YMN5_9HYPH|nr:sugar ABC transporter permease [Devosia algicola]WDR02570.1 sugar ABC transporter permease [Devosia algicola]